MSPKGGRPRGSKRPAGKAGKRPAGAPGGRASDRERPRGDGRDWHRGRGHDDRPRTSSGDAPTKRGPRKRDDGGKVCVIGQQGKFLVAEPFFDGGDRIVLGRGGAEEGELVLVVPDRAGVPQIVERLGNAEVTADVISALLRERDYSPLHDEATLKAAAEAVKAPDPAAASRRDLTELPTFTIDPKTAKDFDDAISAEEHPQGALIRVHIADVTSFAPAGSIVDRAGRERATSTYVPGFVAPMLPPQLADDACSLVPGVDRRAVTIEMIVGDGICLGAEVYRSTIRSDMRLTYEDVDEIFEGRAQAQDPWARPLAIARQVARDLTRQRPQALELDIPEPEFEFDPQGQVTSQRPSQHTESHKLIEQLMVLANEQVARILEAAGAPGMFRIHELPEAAGAERLVEQLLSLG
ncbi:MAG: RNB domain-containing ribonuclease, partial [Solirubrobacteraceae bacterium]|nr:RNB domain-containing ribonuclease [Solirubrobacteraceae bacterium]